MDGITTVKIWQEVVNVYLEKFYWNDSGCEKNLAYTRQDKKTKSSRKTLEWKSSNGNNTIVTWTVRGFVGTIFVIVTFSTIDNTFTFVVGLKLQNV